MPTPDLLTALVGPLDRAGLAYFLTGSVASIVYGEPRLTQDVDLVLHLRLDEIVEFAAAYPEAQYYCPPREVLELEATRKRRGHFNVIHYASGFRADIYLMGDDPLHRWAMQGRRQIEFAGQRLWLAPPEYVIIRKLEYYREGGSDKHLRDIAGILAGVGEGLDRAWLTAAVRERALEREWKTVLASR